MTLDNIIKQIAKTHHTTPTQVRRQMEAAIEEAKRSKDPAVQARWAAIPHKGDEVTLEDLINYIASFSRLSSQ